eukprot:gb/GEZN01006087.1/.p1 GENE.gb/GEZN01006087.1/~~gb/GEZN01006087.1/.p1  ORF type:complete len:440 (-),score=57.86 gb/GEZN01006087.1/:395-1627(-)
MEEGGKKKKKGSKKGAKKKKNKMKKMKDKLKVAIEKPSASVELSQGISVSTVELSKDISVSTGSTGGCQVASWPQNLEKGGNSSSMPDIRPATPDIRSNTPRPAGSGLTPQGTPRVFDPVQDNVLACITAASTGDIPSIKLLLDEKANVNAGDYDGRTPLHLAAANGHIKAVEYILSIGGHPGQKDRFGNTPCDDAERGGTGPTFRGICKILRECGGVSENSQAPKPLSFVDCPLHIFTSTLPRALQTVAPVMAALPGAEMREEQSLRMVDMGVCHGLKQEEIKRLYPEEFKAWEADKFRYRYPSGESLQDLVGQLLPVVLEIERHHEPVLVVSHLSTLQVLYGYFLGFECNPEDYVNLSIPSHTLIRMEPHHYGWKETRFHYTEHEADDGEITWVVKTEEISHSTKFYK